MAPFAELGATCEEHSATLDASWGVLCVRDPGWKSRIAGDGPEQISYGEAEVSGSSGESTSQAALAWLLAATSIAYEESDAATLGAWVAEHFDDPECDGTVMGGDCRVTIGPVAWGLGRDNIGMGEGLPRVALYFGPPNEM